jgi:chromosome segregation ATPase
MSDDLEGFAEWRDTTEARVSRLEVAVETEARARAQMDNDMSDLKVEFRAQRSLLQALAQTQSEHTATLAGHTRVLDDHTRVLDDHTRRLIRLEAGMTDVRAKITTVEAGVQTIISMLDRQIGDNAAD